MLFLMGALSTALAEPTAQEAPEISLAVTVPALEIEAQEIQCPSPPPTVAGLPGAGALTVQLRLRKDAVQLVTVSDIDPGMEWLTPCFERELAEVKWPWSSGRHQVVLEVAPAAGDEPPALDAP